MKRRQFLALTGATLAAGVVGAHAARLIPGRRVAIPTRPTDAAAFRAARRLWRGRVA